MRKGIKRPIQYTLESYFVKSSEEIKQQLNTHRKKSGRLVSVETNI